MNSDTRELIAFSEVTKQFHKRQVLNPVTFTLSRGKSLAILGPNGAGKTTLIRLMLGVIPQSSGQVAVFGAPIEPSSFESKKKIGVVIEEQTFFLDMTAWEYLRFFGELYQVGDIQNRAGALLRYMELYDSRSKKIREYSTGMKKKLNIIQAVLHKPEILIFDEPFSGLDPQGIYLTVNLLKEMKKSGSTLIICSHILSEIDDLVDDLLIINSGDVKAYGSKTDLWRKSDGGYSLDILLIEENTPGIERLGNLSGVVSWEKQGQCRYRLSVAGDERNRRAIAEAIVASGLLVAGITYSEPSVAMVYSKIMESAGLPQEPGGPVF
ncbi:ABC transporter ATP-binding protein [Breznakiella homolactica]|uniref:ABC transporter ATP-binding protein n=1 Tax=Breznakiella homolactica TaxID=2798577 RepID=A0A7T8BC26_9SPIR|nr:ABC transporter ATP-binding protein [Breznakiella homolactica]QQO11162.1 ABC transporter ATP-binding protein [Breznakiella homolactica]